MLRGARVRLQPIDARLARAMLVGAPNPDLAWEDGFPLTSVLAIARVISDSSEPLGPFPAYVIVRQSDGLAIGDAGFHGPPNATGAVEIGYALVPAARGAGFVHDAVGLLIDWTWDQPAVQTITARVDTGNAASERVLKRHRFLLDRESDGMRRFVLERPSVP